MCCVVAALLLVGPRAGVVVWWLLAPGRFEAAFATVIVPLLGFFFLPWTTLAYLVVFPSGVNGLDWLVLLVGVLADLSSYGGGVRSRADRSRYAA